LVETRVGANRPAVVDQKKPSMTMFLFLAVAVQVMVIGAYTMYKKRRDNAPKKYL